MGTLHFLLGLGMFSLLGVCGALGSPVDRGSTAGYRAAVRQLESPRTWCQGAATLARTRHTSAVAPLLLAYESRAEAEKLCLLEALDALNSVALVRQWAISKDPEQRRMAAHLMELSAGKTHLPSLVALCADTDTTVRRQALRAIAAQKQNSAWETAMIALLSSKHIDARERAVRSLSRRRTGTAHKALQDRLAVENDAHVRKAIEKALGSTRRPGR